MKKVALTEDEWFIVRQALHTKKLVKDFSAKDVKKLSKKISNMY